MPTIERTFPVQAPAHQVLQYMRDFSHATEWDPPTQTCTQVSPGDIAIGTRWKNVSKILFSRVELDYTLVEESDTFVVLQGSGKNVVATDTITVVPSSEADCDHCDVTYRAEIVLPRDNKVISFILNGFFTVIARQIIRRIQGKFSS